MKIAVALFGDRVSPNFSTAPELLILVAHGRATPCCWKADAQGKSLRQRALQLLSMGVDVLICGGIDRTTRNDLERKGIRVVSEVRGNPLEALHGLLGPQAAAAASFTGLGKRGSADGRSGRQGSRDREKKHKPIEPSRRQKIG